MAGPAVAAKAMLPAIRVIGVEPRQGNDTQLSLAAGHRVTISPPTTILDGQVNTAPARRHSRSTRRSRMGSSSSTTTRSSTRWHSCSAG